MYKPESQLMGFSECMDMIAEHSSDRHMLRVFMAALTDKALLQGNPLHTSVSKHAQLFGILAKQFKKDLVDPLDKPATRKRTYDRIL